MIKDDVMCLFIVKGKTIRYNMFSLEKDFRESGRFRGEL